VKRLVVFLVLLALGIVALRLVVGDEQVVKTEPDQPARAQEPGPRGVDLQQGSGGASVSQSGPLDLTRWRDVPEGGGRIRKEEEYVLSAKDSQPIGDGLQQLDDVTLRLFERGVHTATVTADRAFVELSRDANGRPTIDERKTIDLRGAVLTTTAASKAAGLRLEFGDCRVTIDERDVLLTTLPEQAVTMTIAGDRPATLRGTGAQARLPRGSSAAAPPADIEILRDPVLEATGLVVRARGRLRYLEDTENGAAIVSLDDDVSLALDDAQIQFGRRRPAEASAGNTNPTAERTGASARGDQFTGWLLRQRDEAQDGTETQDWSWRRLLLVGAPAVVDIPGIQLTTPRLRIRPGLFGDPFLITAFGGESRLQQTGPLDPRLGGALVGVSPRRIHLIRPGDEAGAALRAFGFPRWTLRSLDQQQLVAIEGRATLESPERTITTTDGLHVMRRIDDETAVIVGQGAVEVRERDLTNRRPELLATGSDGFELQTSPTRERLRLGPPPPPAGSATLRWLEHRYDMRYGKATATGRGTCTGERRGERLMLLLEAPRSEIQADLPDDGGTLRGLHRLEAEFDGETLLGAEALGLPAQGTFRRGGEEVEVQAPRLHLPDARTLRLRPMPADEAPWSELPALDRTPTLLSRWTDRAADASLPSNSVEVRGPSIDVHHAGGGGVVIDAIAVDGELPHVYARLTSAPERPPTAIACGAERLRILPFVLPPETRRMHFAGRTGPLADAIFHGVANPWLVVDHVRDFQLDDERHGHVEGTARQLFLSQGGAAALFVGDPDDLTPAIVRRTKDGRSVATTGARVRVFRGDSTRLQALGSFADRSVFLPPTLTLRNEQGGGLLSHMQAVCQGNIDVLPEQVQFTGPVVADGLTPAGDLDPLGLHVDAGSLTLDRQPATGEVSRLLARNFDLRWRGMAAKGRELEGDITRTRIVVRDDEGATVDLPDGRHIESPRVEVNYGTWSVNMGRGRVTQRARQPIDPDAPGAGAAPGQPREPRQ
jgi:hypothetical protein